MHEGVDRPQPAIKIGIVIEKEENVPRRASLIETETEITQGERKKKRKRKGRERRKKKKSERKRRLVSTAF